MLIGGVGVLVVGVCWLFCGGVGVQVIQAGESAGENSRACHALLKARKAECISISEKRWKQWGVPRKNGCQHGDYDLKTSFLKP